jgi:hypothetical protein
LVDETRGRKRVPPDFFAFQAGVKSEAIDCPGGRVGGEPFVFSADQQEPFRLLFDDSAELRPRLVGALGHEAGERPLFQLAEEHIVLMVVRRELAFEIVERLGGWSARLRWC